MEVEEVEVIDESFKAELAKTCEACGGTGKPQEQHSGAAGRRVITFSPGGCSKCGGLGEVPTEKGFTMLWFMERFASEYRGRVYEDSRAS